MCSWFSTLLRKAIHQTRESAISYTDRQVVALSEAARTLIPSSRQWVVSQSLLLEELSDFRPTVFTAMIR